MMYLLPVLGFLIGAVASMVGVGGGVFVVPLLTLAYEFSPSQAVGTSLAAIIFTSVASAANYARQKRIYFKTGLILATATVPGAYLGAYLTTILEERLLGLFFGFFLLAVAGRMIFRPRIFRRERPASRSSDERTVSSESLLLEDKGLVLVGAALSFLGGMSSGLLGIGGGSVLVPIMVLVMNIPMHTTVATSMFTMIFTSASGSMQHFLSDHVSIEYVLLLASGTVLGAQVGALTSKRISGKNLRRIFGMVLVVVGIRMILKFL